METTNPSGTPEWADMYTNETIFSIRQYVRQRPRNEHAYAHMRDFAPFVETYWNEMRNIPVLVETTNRWDDPQCRTMISAIAWLAAFIDRDYDVNTALSALFASPNHCTRLLMRFLVLLDNHTIMEVWKMEALDIMKSRDTQTRLQIHGYDAISVSRYIQRQCERFDMVIFSLWKSLQQATRASLLHRERQITSSKVANFCMLAGCPFSEQNPLKNVEMLREYLAARPSETREAKLRQEVDELRRENQMQQRIITNLTFRHLLENLPPTPPRKMSSTARWSHFFKNALKTAQNQTGTESPPHPLAGVLRKYPNASQVETVGVGLYSTFSTNIHCFSSQFTVVDSQWNALECDIMKALAPLPSNDTSDGTEWQRERQRY